MRFIGGMSIRGWMGGFFCYFLMIPRGFGMGSAAAVYGFRLGIWLGVWCLAWRNMGVEPAVLAVCVYFSGE